jgi:OmpA-OmpF porin, OOP family
MGPSLLNELTDATGALPLASLASQLGASEADVERGTWAAGAATLATLASRASDTNLMQEVVTLARDQAAAPTEGVASPGLTNRLVSLVFGPRASAMTQAIAQHVNLPAPLQSTLMTVAAPLVLSVLGRHIKAEGLSAAGLASLLASERAEMHGAAPPTADATASTMRPPALAAESLTPVPPARPSRVVPLLALAAALVVAWLALHRAARSNQGVAINTAVGVHPESAAGAVAAPLGATTSLALPNGANLRVPVDGIESKMVTFIMDSSQHVNDTTWFAFDRLRFAPNAADLAPESSPQLSAIAAIFTAYPDVKAKIGGLSADRTEHVRQALIADGVASDHLEAQSDGNAHPPGIQITAK